ncbi:unnamed protein product [Echinostoma caproni]|uniref:SH2 domain-containing protein n=1 Tax=Echinostoma caproni TaxID=27848 RepID=A0A183AR94_9TREM|nr:unnamed protein product [Echinostoma caproni]
MFYTLLHKIANEYAYHVLTILHHQLTTKKKQPGSLQRPATEESNLLALGELPKPTRFRRSSFALTGERPTKLDVLVQEAAEHVTQVAASREAAKITFVVPSPSEVTEFQTNGCNTLDDDSDENSRKFSVATTISASDELTDNLCRSVSIRTPDGCFPVNDTEPQHKFVWHNTESFTHNPLSSELVRKYLALVATESSTPEPEILISVSPPSGSPAMFGNLPGIMQLATSTVSSMTMPVHQLRRAHAMNMHSSREKPLCSSFNDSCSSMRGSCLSDRHALTDTNYSSGVSDTEQWGPFGQQMGYQSDNYMRNAASEAKRLRMAGQRLEADFHRSTNSLPRSKKSRSRSKSGAPSIDSLPPAVTPASHRSSKFDLTHVYEGLPVVGLASSNATTSAAASVASSPPSRAPCVTPPCSPSTGFIDSDHQSSLGSTNGLGRLKLFFDHWKPHVAIDDDGGNYIYLDKQAQERRVNARASNVIAPVSF